MLEPLRQLAALLLSYGLLLLANGLFTTLLSLRTKLEGFPTEIIGLVMGAYYLGLFLGARYAAGIVHRVGHIRAFGVFASLVSITPLVHMLWISPPLWSGLRLISGFGMAGLIVVTESWLNARADNHNRGSLLSIYMLINYLGAGSAQLLLLLDEPGGFRLFTLASIIFSLSLIPVLLTRTHAPLPEAPGALRIGPVLKASPVGFWGALSAGLMNASFYAMGPLFAQEAGLSMEQISLFMALGICGGLVLQTPLGRLSDRIERRRVIAGVSLGIAACCALVVYLVQQNYAAHWLLVGSFLYGCLAFTIYSLSGAHANDWGDPNRRMQTSGALLAGFGIGAVAGPLMSGTLMGEVGPAGLFLFNATVALVLGLYSFRHCLGEKGRVNKPPFVPKPAAQYSSGEIYEAVQNEIGQDNQHAPAPVTTKCATKDDSSKPAG